MSQEIVKCVEIRVKDATNSRHKFCTNKDAPAKFVAYSDTIHRDPPARDITKLNVGLRSIPAFHQRGPAMEAFHQRGPTMKDSYPPDIAYTEFDAPKIWQITFWEQRREGFNIVLQIDSKQMAKGLRKNASQFLHEIDNLIYYFDPEHFPPNLYHLETFGELVEKLQTKFPTLKIRPA